MAEIIKIASNAVTAKLHEPSREVKLEAQRALSYAVEGAEHSSAFKTGNWDGRSSMLDFRAGTFPAGFVYFVAAKLRAKGFEVRLVKKPLPITNGPENPKVDAFPEDPRYDYQMEVVRRLTKHGQIIAQVATGGGKSRIARLAYSRINRPTLFLTTRGILMYQMKDAFEKDLGIPCSVLGDGQFGHTDATGQQFIKKMSVGMVQTLTSRLEETTFEREYEKLFDAATRRNDKAVAALRKTTTSKAIISNLMAKHSKLLTLSAKTMKAQAEKNFAAQTAIRGQTISLLAKFEFVILEEAHEASGNSYFDILKHCKNAYYRLALTATPFMRDDEEANMRLMASSGPIAIKVTEKMLIDRGILATPKFKFVELKKNPPKLVKGSGWDAAYRIGIVDNQERNEAIVNEVHRAANYGLSSMVLIQHTRHGDILCELLTARGLRCEYLQGSDDQADRKRTLSKLANGEIDVLIGTSLLDVGVDCPAIGLVVLGGGGKAEVSLRQRIGRGLRAKKTGPNVAHIVDFNDPFNNHTKGHAMARRAIVDSTDGFLQGVLAPGEDFDYSVFKERKAA